MRKGKVVIGYVHPAEVAACFHESLINLLMSDVNGSTAVVNGGGRIAHYSSANISNARNGIVRKFLEQTQAEWLLFIDADMQFPPDLVDRLLVDADEQRAPIVGALCFGIEDTQLFATLYDLTTNDDGQPQMVRYKEWPEDAMFQVAATGAACILIHRRVLEALQETYPEPFPWFSEGVLGKAPMGEDISFCLRAGVAGFPIHVHTGIPIGHAKTQILTTDMYARQRQLEKVKADD